MKSSFNLKSYIKLNFSFMTKIKNKFNIVFLSVFTYICITFLINTITKSFTFSLNNYKSTFHLKRYTTLKFRHPYNHFFIYYWHTCPISKYYHKKAIYFNLRITTCLFLITLRTRLKIGKVIRWLIFYYLRCLLNIM